MKKLYSLLIIFIAINGEAQVKFDQIRKKSWVSHYYKITSKQFEYFTAIDSIPIESFEKFTPQFILNADSTYINVLPNGNYVKIDIVDYHITATLINISSLKLLTVNNKNKLQLVVATTNNTYLNNAQVFVKNKEVLFNTASQTYLVQSRNIDEAFVKVYASNDTLYTNIAVDKSPDVSITNQKKAVFKTTTFYKILHFIPTKIANIFKKHRKPVYNTNGYIIFNQPKYKIKDTVKYKAYLLNDQLKPFEKSLQVILNYKNKGKYVEQVLDTLAPITKGDYVGSFVLSDTLPLDVTYSVSFKYKQRILKAASFSTEDYLLDQVSSYQFSSSSTDYYLNDTLEFTASAKDANQLNVLDATVALTITTAQVYETFADTVFVADTLYIATTKLLANGDTKFKVPTALFPKANMSLSAVLKFSNANNETHTEQKNIDYFFEKSAYLLLQKNDTVYATFLSNNKSVHKKALIQINDAPFLTIDLPFMQPINPLVATITLKSVDSNATTQTLEIDAKSNVLQFEKITQKDTLGFRIFNPYKIPVYYTVFNKNDIIYQGKDSAKNITWQRLLKNSKDFYEVRYQYYWGGVEQSLLQYLTIPYNILSANVTAKSTVFPGEIDNIQLNVIDYKGTPVQGVNLTAVSYNNEFNKDIKYPKLPYLVNYHQLKSLNYETFLNDDLNNVYEKSFFSKNSGWVHKFGLDTMDYYKILLQQNKVYTSKKVIYTAMPQVAISVFDKMVPQPIFLLYVNKKFVYYNAVNVPQKYAYEVQPGYTQFEIRLLDKTIYLDSVYVQPNYKYDFFIDMADLPKHARVVPNKKYWSIAEMNLIEKQIMVVKKSYNNNGAFIWQSDRVFNLVNNQNDYVIGPFNNGTVQFYKPNHFDINVDLESPYLYDFAPKKVRLEKMYLFPVKDTNNRLQLKNTLLPNWGDTLVAPPVIAYNEIPKSTVINFIEKNNAYVRAAALRNKLPYGKLQLQFVTDSSIKYVVLMHCDTVYLVNNFYYNNIDYIKPGMYDVLLITTNNTVFTKQHIVVMPYGSTFVKLGKLTFVPNHPIVTQLKAEAILYQQKLELQYALSLTKQSNPTQMEPYLFDARDAVSIRGILLDEKTKEPIPFATIRIDGYQNGTSTNDKGIFQFKNLRKGTYQLLVSAVGYNTNFYTVTLNTQNISLTIYASVSKMSLEEVVVTGYATTQRKFSMVGAAASIRSNDNVSIALNGKVAGVNITNSNNGVFIGESISLRGLSSLTGNNEALIVIDGIIQNAKKFSDINPADILSVDILDATKSVILFGAQGANGVIMVKTKTQGIRKNFKDYAFWVPNFFTDKNGQASFDVKYPDNITGWKTFIVGMDIKNRILNTNIFTQAFKPIAAQVNAPTFLIEGDSAAYVSKVLNYTTDAYTVNSTFKINNNITAQRTTTINASDAHINKQWVKASNSDSIKTTFSIETTTGFTDAEERSIPVFKRGTEKAIGNFWVLTNDTTFALPSSNTNATLHIGIVNNTIDILLDELAQLKNYPYACMEQTTSKLMGLQLTKIINEKLKKPFDDQKLLTMLLNKIQTNQLYSGGWSWWPNGNEDVYVTNYITKVLLKFNNDPSVASNIRNAFLYLQNQLPVLSNERLIATLHTLSEGKHVINYEGWLNKVKFDSLSIHAQWQYVRILQNQKMDYANQLTKVMKAASTGILGDIHWGTQNYRWESNEVATTLIAYKVFENNSAYQSMLPKIIQYFISKRGNGYWSNTVETASIIETILPEVLKNNNDVQQPTKVTIAGDTNIVVTKFPYKASFTSSTSKNLQINKSGNGITYFTSFQQFFDANPITVDTNFVVQTSFLQSNNTVTQLKAGESVIMNVTINALKEAEYVMIEIPIPAGCNVAQKNAYQNGIYKEFYKDKILMFVPNLQKGMFTQQIPLQVRYTGKYFINPAKVSLMYFPIFYGQNSIKNIEITE
ncbi:carboxypeptidase-like regulatory domain-containing protein [Ferruginibacter yonginensis]|uniref:Carboxypeptidase-like regulatory domain-containing protein n=1 Tax=Ferruginibacter yonginensis TaxID=1310416 RepID=A0ABV8QTU6_9BACT